MLHGHSARANETSSLKRDIPPANASTMEGRGPRNRALTSALALALVLSVAGRTSCQSQRSPHADYGPRSEEEEEGGLAVLPSPPSIVFPESPWSSRLGQYQEGVESPEYIPMEGQLCPEGHRLVGGECKLVLV